MGSQDPRGVLMRWGRGHGPGLVVWAMRRLRREQRPAVTRQSGCRRVAMSAAGVLILNQRGKIGTGPSVARVAPGS